MSAWAKLSHMRALVFCLTIPRLRIRLPRQVRAALPNTSTQGQTQFEDTANMLKFGGVAKADWEIPQKMQLGDILITSEVVG